MLRLKKIKFQSSGTSIEDTYAKKLAQLQAEQDANITQDVDRAEMMVLGAYQKPQQIFADTPAANPVQLASPLSAPMSYSPTLSQYVGSTTPIQLAGLNYNRAMNKGLGQYKQAINIGEVLEPDLQKRENVIKEYQTEFEKISTSGLPLRQQFKATQDLKNKFSNDLRVKALYDRKETRDTFVNKEIERANKGEITHEEANRNINRFDRNYAKQGGIGENFMNPYNKKGFAKIVDTEKFVNDVLANIKPSSKEWDLSSGWVNNGAYYFKNKKTGAVESVTEEEVNNALMGAYNVNPLLRERVKDEASLFAGDIDSERYKSETINKLNKDKQQYESILASGQYKGKPLTAEQKKAYEDVLNNIKNGINKVSQFDESSARAFAEKEYESNYINNLKSHASKGVFTNTKEGNDQDIHDNWLAKLAAKKQAIDEINRRPLDSAPTEITRQNLKTKDLPKSLKDYGSGATVNDKLKARGVEVKRGTKFLGETSVETNIYYKNGKELTEEELSKEIDSVKSSSSTYIDKAKDIAKNDPKFNLYLKSMGIDVNTAKYKSKGLFGFSTPEGQEDAKLNLALDQAYQMYVNDDNTQFSTQVYTQDAKTLESQTKILPALLSSQTVDGLPVKQVALNKLKGVKGKNGKDITSVQDLYDNANSYGVDVYNQEGILDIAGVQVRTGLSNRAKSETQVFGDATKAMESGKPKATTFTLGIAKLSGEVTPYINPETKKVDYYFVPKPKDNYEKQVHSKYFKDRDAIPSGYLDALYQEYNTNQGTMGGGDVDDAGKKQLNVKFLLDNE
jgi:hypothetical protein